MGTGPSPTPNHSAAPSSLPATPPGPAAVGPGSRLPLSVVDDHSDVLTDNGPREECGVFGVWAPGEEVAKLTLLRPVRAAAPRPGGRWDRGRRRLPDRGVQGSRPGLPGVRRADAVIAARAHRGRPLPVLHHRVGTWENAQPTFAITDVGTGIALGHNGNLVNTSGTGRPGRRAARPAGRSKCTTDSDVVTRLLASASADSGLEAAAMELLPTLQGRVLPGVLRRAHPVRRAGPARRPPAGARPAGPRLGGRVGDRSAGHRRRHRSSARWSRASCSPSTRTGCAASISRRRSRRAACSSTSTWPGRTPPSPAAACRRPAWRSAAGSPSSPRSRRTWSSRRPSPAPRRRSASPRRPASRTARAW